MSFSKIGGGTVSTVNGKSGTVTINAQDVPYDNSTSGLTATDTKAAIDEINASSGASKFTDTFDATTDWGTASGGYYTITYLESTHGKGTNPIIQVFENNGGNFDHTTPDRVRVNSSGDVEIRVTESIDSRFAGKIIIL